MSSLDIRKAKNWNYQTFKKWLNSEDIISSENEIFDFKSELYTSGKECRKDFSSFANCEGGFIIFGIDGEAKKAVGVSEIDINTRIEDFLNPNCLNPEIQWSIIKQFVVPPKKRRLLIYIARIEKTIPFWLRPHVSDGTIYVRKNGKSEPIKTLSDLRQRFFQKHEFIPEDIIYFDSILSKAKECNFNIDVYDIFIVRLWVGIRHYLDNLEVKKKGVPKKFVNDRKVLLGLYDEISSYLSDAKKKKAELSISTGMPDVHSTNNELEKIYQTITERMESFISLFVKFISTKYE